MLSIYTWRNRPNCQGLDPVGKRVFSRRKKLDAEYGRRHRKFTPQRAAGRQGSVLPIWALALSPPVDRQGGR